MAEVMRGERRGRCEAGPCPVETRDQLAAGERGGVQELEPGPVPGPSRRRLGRRLAAALWLIAVAPLSPGGSALHAQEACCLQQGLTVARQYRAPGLDDRHFDHDQLWDVIAPYLASDRIRFTELGHSIERRTINAVTFGTGTTTVLLWSQMHGNESTATMALADLINYFATAPGTDRLLRTLDSALTITMIPMLNPDGAERFMRENALGVDVNRDARRAATPEGRILKHVRDSIGAEFGFNLHDQGSRTAGADGLLVGIALLAPAADMERSWAPVRLRARQVAAVIAGMLEQEIPGRVARYDDAFTPRAFGDLMQQWGTSTVLIESGVLPDDPHKQRLRAINVAALLSALNAIATGEYAAAAEIEYDRLPMNRAVTNDLLLLGGRVVVGVGDPIRADIAIVYDDEPAHAGPRYGEIGDLDDVVAIDTVDVTGLYVHPRLEGGILRRGAFADLVVRRGLDPTSDVVWRLSEGGR